MSEDEDFDFKPKVEKKPEITAVIKPTTVPTKPNLRIPNSELEKRPNSTTMGSTNSQISKPNNLPNKPETTMTKLTNEKENEAKKAKEKEEEESSSSSEDESSSSSSSSSSGSSSDSDSSDDEDDSSSSSSSSDEGECSSSSSDLDTNLKAPKLSQSKTSLMPSFPVTNHHHHHHHHNNHMLKKNHDEMSKKLVQPSPANKRTHKSSNSEKSKKEETTKQQSQTTKESTNVVQKDKKEELISFDIENDEEKAEDANNITLTGLIEKIVSPNKKSASSSSNTSPQLPIFSQGSSSAHPILSAAFNSVVQEPSQDHSVPPLDSGITFTFSDDEIDDNSNASSHNMANLLSLNAPQTNSNINSNSQSPNVQTSTPPTQMMHLKPSSEDDETDEASNLIPFSSLQEKSIKVQTFSPTPMSAGFIPSNLNPLPFANLPQPPSPDHRTPSRARE